MSDSSNSFCNSLKDNCHCSFHYRGTCLRNLHSFFNRRFYSYIRKLYCLFTTFIGIFCCRFSNFFPNFSRYLSCLSSNFSFNEFHSCSIFAIGCFFYFMRKSCPFFNNLACFYRSFSYHSDCFGKFTLRWLKVKSMSIYKRNETI